MPFAYVIQSLQDGQAARRPTMGGYVAKTVTNAETGAYTLTYKNKSGTTYVYTFNGTSWTAPGTTIPFDAEFHAMMLASDWQVIDVAELTEGTW